MLNLDTDRLNNALKGSSPEDIIDFALGLSQEKIVTTSFGIYSAVLLRSMTALDPCIPVIWCDTGYNTPRTYAHARMLIDKLGLDVHIYTPRLTRGFIEASIGMPVVGSREHDKFTEIVKLEPFRRALNEWKPTIWFTNIRTRQTRHRDSKDIFSYSKEGILKVSPFYYCSDADLDDYLKRFELPKNTDYFDPVKALQSRECGIHHI
jgi:phosphoadenosine phosphosulfate reductase